MSNKFKEFNIGTFNVRGLMKEQKQEFLARDIDNYNLDVCCLQETKIAEGIDQDIGDRKHKLVAFQSDCRFYGNGFVIDEKWKKQYSQVLESVRPSFGIAVSN